MGAFEREVGVKRQEPKSVEQIYKEFVRSLFRNDYHALYHYSKFTIDSEKETSSLSSVKYKGNQESSVRVIADAGKMKAYETDKEVVISCNRGTKNTEVIDFLASNKSELEEAKKNGKSIVLLGKNLTNGYKDWLSNSYSDLIDNIVNEPMREIFQPSERQKYYQFLDLTTSMGEDPKKIEEYLSKELFFNRSDKDCFGNIVDKFRHYDMDLDRISSMIGGSYNAHFDKDKKFKFHDLNGVYEKMISLGSKVKLNLSDEGKFEVTIQDGKLGLKGNENTQNQELDNSSSMGMN